MDSPYRRENWHWENAYVKASPPQQNYPTIGQQLGVSDYPVQMWAYRQFVAPTKAYGLYMVEYVIWTPIMLAFVYLPCLFFWTLAGTTSNLALAVAVRTLAAAAYIYFLDVWFVYTLVRSLRFRLMRGKRVPRRLGEWAVNYPVA